MASAKTSWMRRIAPPPFVLFAVVALGVGAVVGAYQGWQDGILIGFDVGAAAFLAAMVPLMRDAKADDMRRRAEQNDANRLLLLLLTAAVAIVILAAVALELTSKQSPTPGRIALVVATLVLSWLFTNIVYTLHYAHIYYLKADEGDGDAGGLDFPKTSEPEYSDFIYFAFTLGMTFQTSDTDICSPHLRRVVTMHSLVAFVFNIGVVAFTINVLGSKGG